MRWWRRHRLSRLVSWVGPWGQGLTWSMSQKTAEMVQPGKRQRRSRVLIRVAIRRVGRYGPARSVLTAEVDRWLAPGGVETLVVTAVDAVHLSSDRRGRP